jgi:hypothetical protein
VNAPVMEFMRTMAKVAMISISAVRVPKLRATAYQFSVF